MMRQAIGWLAQRGQQVVEGQVVGCHREAGGAVAGDSVFDGGGAID